MEPEKQTMHTDDDGALPLHSACSAGSVEIVEMLLTNQPESQATQADVNGHQPLHRACESQCRELIALLLRHAPETQLHHPCGRWASLVESNPVYFECFENLLQQGVLKEHHLPFIAEGETRQRMQERVSKLRGAKSARSTLGKRDRVGAELPENE